MTRNYYDPLAQIARAAEWLAEAENATSDAMRSLCLNEAASCCELVQRSFFTPALSERLAH